MTNKRRYQRALSALLTLALLLGLAACGSKDGDSGGGNGNSKNDIVYAPMGDKVYVPEKADLPAGLNTVAGAYLDGDTLYFTDASVQYFQVTHNGFTFDDNRYVYRVLRAAVGGETAEALAEYQPTELPEEACGTVRVSIIGAGGSGEVWVQENLSWYYFDVPPEFDPAKDERWTYRSEIEGRILCRLLDSDGNELRQVDLTALAQDLGVDTTDVFSRYDIDFDRSGNAYVVTNDRVYVFDQNMELLFTLEGASMTKGAVTLSSGDKAVHGYVDGGLGGESGYQLRTIDLENKAWGESIHLPSNSNTIFDGGAGFLFCYNSGDGLYGWETATGQPQKLFSWFDTDLNQNGVYLLAFLEDGRMLLLTRDWSNAGGVSSKMIFSILTAVDRSSVQLSEKTILTYATVHVNIQMEEMIKAFNRSNDNYAIQVRDYTELTGGNYSAAYTLMETEIQAGYVPDILDTMGLPVEQLGTKGYLEDLWPWIDNDPELGRENLMTRVLDAASYGGKLYQAFSTFSIRTIKASTSVVGERLSWTVDDIVAAWQTMPEDCTIFNPSDTKASVLEMILPATVDAFVNWETGECSFESDEFKSLLKFCDLFPLTYNPNDYADLFPERVDRLNAGEQMLDHRSNIYDYDDFQMDRAIFNGAVSYIGFPTVDGSCGSSFVIGHFGSTLAMSATCADKEAAWSFIRQQLIPQFSVDDRYRNLVMFPINRIDFEWMAEKVMTPQYATFPDGTIRVDKDGNPREEPRVTVTYDSVTASIFATSQEDLDQLMALYNAIDRMGSSSGTIGTIVEDMAGAYFAGDRSLDETARLIQSRVNLYVNENR